MLKCIFEKLKVLVTKNKNVSKKRSSLFIYQKLKLKYRQVKSFKYLKKNKNLI